MGPVSEAQKFSDLMPKLFDQYWDCRSNTSSFSDFTKNTTDLKVVCKDATAQKVDFTTPSALETAIQNSTRINSPSDADPWGAPTDDSWTVWMDMTIDDLIKGTDISRGGQELVGRLFYQLGRGLVVNDCRHVLGHRLFQHHADHWTFMIRDRSPLKDDNGKDYLLRSEILGITSILYRQMNEQHQEYTQPRLTYQHGKLTATIITFMIGKVRVVQATCNPSDQNPTMTCTLRGSYDLRMSCYNKSSVHEIVKWILCPPGPSQGLSLRPKKA
ncbi:hypothetical protein FQN50_001718 [Emmonsiellopsis sp. PD_5]|nr:hypothetical protein FQN50_001718 [Emmonsiellopsis sp. PD_5]